MSAAIFILTEYSEVEIKENGMLPVHNVIKILHNTSGILRYYTSTLVWKQH